MNDAAAASETIPGLSAGEAAQRLAQFGPNALPEAPPLPFWTRILNQFRSPLVYILVFALLLDFGLWVHEGAHGLPIESIAIAAILTLNAWLGAWQESKADDALAHLQTMAVSSVWVLRDGVPSRLPATALVPGDVVRVEAGDRVPADGVLLSGDGVLIDESILTGESVPVDKVVAGPLSSGTLLVRGKAYIEVRRTGRASAMGQLATMIGAIETGTTPLERRLAVFGRQVALAILLIGVMLTLGGVMVEGVTHIGPVVLFSVALAVAAVPEALPAVLTLTLALGVERLAGRRAIVRRLSAVEALGSVTVIATDKTGTLTENRMQVRAVDAADEAALLVAMALATDAERTNRAGDPLELELLDHAASRGVDPARLAADHPRIDSRPFDSSTRSMSVTVRAGADSVTYLKGAPEVVIAGAQLSPAERQQWEATALARAGEGYRVIAFAERRGGGLHLLGLAHLWDPPRAEVPDALREAAAAGIRVVMVTGDHPATAEAIGRAVGIEARRVLTGEEAAALGEAAFAEAVREVGVFARFSPAQKLRLVEALQADGEIVAVTGDGVNDAPALKRADVGIAMGQRGSDVAREVADIVLIDDNFATIVAAVEEGRSIYDNVQKFIRFFFSTDLALVVLMSAGLVVAYLQGWRDPSTGTFLLPLTAVQLLWINVLADGPPALAIALDRNRDVMARPPRPPSSRLLDANSLLFIAVSGFAKAGVGLAILALLPRMGFGLEEARTALFLYEALLQLVFAYPSRHVGATPEHNPWMHAAVGGGAALQLAAVLLPPLAVLLGLTPIGWQLIVAVIGLVLLTWAAAEWLWRIVRPRRRSMTEG